MQVADCALILLTHIKWLFQYVVHRSEVLNRRLLLDIYLSVNMKFVSDGKFTHIWLKLMYGYDNKVDLHLMVAADESGHFHDCRIN
jgi:hypothetical protein